MSRTKGVFIAVANHRQSESPRLVHLVRGDLDWIVMKCLEKARARRYETASGLAQDLVRHLNSEPVTAAAHGAAYRTRKFIRRHRYGFATASALLLLLIAGVVVSMWQMMRARVAERQARTVATFLKDMLEGVRPSVALGRDTTLLREILDGTAKRIASDLKGQPAVAAELRHTLGIAYEALGDYAKAATALREALVMQRKAFGNEHLAVAESLSDLAAVLQGQGQLAESEAMLRQAVAMWKKLSGNQSQELAESLNNLGLVLLWEGKLPEAEAMFREVVAMRRKLFGNEHPVLAVSLNNLAAVLQEERKLAEAEALQREALAIYRKVLGNEHPSITASLVNLAGILEQQNKPAEAEAMYREALAMQRKSLGNEHPSVAASLQRLAELTNRPQATNSIGEIRGR